ncbi:MAG: hypothetical protein B7Z75_12405 [Acidocella sp. 20-57-95]|nr:MAG: hypothetical protein B7Z75_12405 [Acidocella sp. 20-57-95]OYV59790.1 MAG: hypothetical protein B7Z71_07375 [Acidocella sp. 21-58-7]HQT63994.1 2OG-Fe(II) oxygenase [Acidocella sp.]HQU03363.1 2OG-Fe(II) oxygenase [Acidocella sp.]
MLIEALAPGAPQFLAALAQTEAPATPFRHWILKDILPAPLVDALARLPLTPPVGAAFSGQREANNALRVYFTPQVQSRFATCRDVTRIFQSGAVLARLQAVTGVNVAAGHLRIEYCQDQDGFWLEPHRDIAVKMFTMLIYVSDDPTLFDAGTDLYDDTPAHNLVGSVPYRKNHGLMFIPGPASWHGFSKRPIRGLRKSLIINYVSSDWKAVDELAEPHLLAGGLA